MKIGIWCDYGFTLEPSEGIGVFVDNLARGLVEADSSCQLTLVPHPGSSDALSPLASFAPNQIRIAERDKPSSLQRRCLRTLTKLKWYFHPDDEGKQDFRTSCGAMLSAAFDQAHNWLNRNQQQVTDQLIAGCDIWLLPYVGLDQTFSKPSVVVVHDLVCYHFPDVMKPTQLRRFRKQVDQQVRQAAVVACMSEFIKAHDLCGTLKLPDERLAVIRSATPIDARIQDESVESEWPAVLNFADPYLFFPSAFRSYKNHRYLVELIARLKSSKLWPMKVVFTGIRRCPAWLQKEIHEYGVAEDVVMLGKVSRWELRQLYRNAFATMVPSLYEQGSFPLMESMQNGCLALAADIPSLREQFADMGPGMHFFDPYQVDSGVQLLNQIHADHRAALSHQQEAFVRMQSRTWKMAAAEWIAVFKRVLDERPHKRASAA